MLACASAHAIHSDQRDPDANRGAHRSVQVGSLTQCLPNRTHHGRRKRNLLKSLAHPTKFELVTSAFGGTRSGDPPRDHSNIKSRFQHAWHRNQIQPLQRDTTSPAGCHTVASVQRASGSIGETRIRYWKIVKNWRAPEEIRTPDPQISNPRVVDSRVYQIMEYSGVSQQLATCAKLPPLPVNSSRSVNNNVRGS